MKFRAKSTIAASAAVVTVFVQHTSCSLTLMEKAGPAARRDVEKFFDKLVPENADYEHDDEGPDDMPSHIRMRRNDYHQQKRIPSHAIILL